MRRNRRSAAVRALTRETRLDKENLIAPLFVHDATGDPSPVGSMPGVFRRNPQQLVEHCKALHASGICAVALFPCFDAALKDAEGTHFRASDNLLLRALAQLKQACPELCLIADVALDPYTSHGHDGLLTADGCDVENDRTVAVLCEMALLQADAGADIVAPSDMMDGRVGAIRNALDAAGHTSTSIMAYAAKFNSAFYGPFRDAVGSRTAAGYLDKSTYQLSPGNAREALLETRLDEEEGADILMVKPAGAYLDIIRDLRESTLLPVAAYQVSGEYAQIHAAAQRGWIDYARAREESLVCIRRAGADMILTYFAEEMAAVLP